ncbi:unnamed protein product [Symbiodinium sp. CCMP2592]|nr:unnamed protein product [Symbiodinium sp. CCMP2592]
MPHGKSISYCAWTSCSTSWISDWMPTVLISSGTSAFTWCLHSNWLSFWQRCWRNRALCAGCEEGGDACCKQMQAVRESWHRGFPSDVLLSVTLREKAVEAPLSFLLQGCATWWLQNAASLSSSQALHVSYISTFFSMMFSLYGMTKAAYINTHLDLGYQLKLLERDWSHNGILHSAAHETQPQVAVIPSCMGAPSQADSVEAASLQQQSDQLRHQGGLCGRLPAAPSGGLAHAMPPDALKSLQHGGIQVGARRGLATE